MPTATATAVSVSSRRVMPEAQDTHGQPLSPGLFAEVALAAKLAAIDGVPNKAEYAAFHALFVSARPGDSARLRSYFVQQVNDRGAPLQYARQLMQDPTYTPGQRSALFDRLLRIATADAPMNAAEMEYLRGVADVFGLTREAFRAAVSRMVSPQQQSPYEMLGVAPDASDEALRAAYMARVSRLHPDRYQAAGVSAETLALLSDQLAALNAAYETVQRERARSISQGVGALWQRLQNKGVRMFS